MQTPVLSLIDGRVVMSDTWVWYTNFLSKLPFTRFILVVKVEVTGTICHRRQILHPHRSMTQRTMVRISQTNIDGPTQLSRRPFIWGRLVMVPFNIFLRCLHYHPHPARNRSLWLRWPRLAPAFGRLVSDTVMPQSKGYSSRIRTLTILPTATTLEFLSGSFSTAERLTFCR